MPIDYTKHKNIRVRPISIDLCVCVCLGAARFEFNRWNVRFLVVVDVLSHLPYLEDRRQENDRVKF